MNKDRTVRIAEFEAIGYHGVVCDDSGMVYAGLMKLMYTTAIAFELNDYGFSERYCFKNPELALRELLAWKDRGFNDQRPIGWIACRGVSSRAIRESFERYYGQDYAKLTLESFMSNKADYLDDAPRLIGNDTGLGVDQISHELAYLRFLGLIL